MNNSFVTALTVTAQSVGRDLGVTVIIGNGSEKYCPCTDGEKIFLPQQCLERHEKSHLLALIVHECAHIRFSEFSSGTYLARKYGKLFFQLLNAVEDARIESLISQEYAGAGALLFACREKSAEKAMSEKDKWADEYTLGMLVLLSFTKKLMGIGHVKSAQSLMLAECEARMIALCGQSFVVKIAKIIEDTELVSFNDTKIATKAIFELVSKQKPQSEQDKGQGKGQGQSSQSEEDKDDDASDSQGESQEDDDSSDSADDSQGQNQGSEEGETSQTSQGNSQEEDGEEGDSQSCQGNSQESEEEGNASDEAQGDSQDGDENTTQSEADKEDSLFDKDFDKSLSLNEGIEKVSEKAFNKSVASTEFLVNKTPFSPNEAGKGETVLLDARLNSSGVRRALQAILQSSARTKKFVKKTGHRLSTNDLYRLKLKDTRVFERKIEGRDFNTAISLVLDRSGSMYQIYPIAVQACMALSCGLFPVKGVVSNVIGFTDNDIRCYVPFGKSPMAQKAEVGTLANPIGMSGTPTQHGLLLAQMELQKRKEAKKVVVLITDGSPNDPQLSVDISNNLRSQGIAVYGILLGDKTPFMRYVMNLMCDAFVELNNVEELQDKLFELTKQVLNVH